MTVKTAIATIGFGCAVLIGAMFLATSAAAAAQPPGVTVLGVEVTCPAGAGRLDVTLSNATTEDRQVTIGIDGVRRPIDVAALGTSDVVITGRNDGTRGLTIDGVTAVNVTVDCGFPDGPDFGVALSSDCSGGVGIIEVELTNPSDADSRAVVTPDLRNSSGYRREVIVPANASATIRISGRSDGINNVAVNGRSSDDFAWIDCVPNTGPNDLIADAKPISLAAPFTIVDPDFDPTDTYGHTAAEIDDTSRCIVISRGSAWYRFVATTDAVIVAGSDDSEVAVYRPLTDQPTELSDLEPVGCNEDFDVALIPGETYLMAFSFDVEPDRTRLYPTSATGHDTVTTARQLVDGFDAAPDLFAHFEEGENTDCFSSPAGVAERGTLWYEWTATADVASFDVLSYRSGGFRDRLSLAYQFIQSSDEYAIYSSTVPSPTLSDLALVGCQQAQVQPGETYWIQVPAIGFGTTAIGERTPDDQDPQMVASCLAGSGRFDITLSNRSQAAVPVELGSRFGFAALARSFELEPGMDRTVTITGRAEGSHSVRTIIGARYYSFPSQVVDCKPDPTTVEVATTCIGGRGRIDVAIPAATERPFPLYTMRFIGPTSTLERQALAKSFATVETVTGRVDGSYMIEVDIDREPAFTEVVLVDCS